MATLYTTTSDSSQPITSFKELRGAMPTVPVNPSIYSFDDETSFSVLVVYGSPDQHHAEVKVFTANGTDRDVFDSFKAATDRFFAIARHAFDN